MALIKILQVFLRAIGKLGLLFLRLIAYRANKDCAIYVKEAISTITPWVESLLRELFVFPNGKYNDPADALIQGLTCLNKGRTCYTLEIGSSLLRDEIKRGLLIKGSPLCLTNTVPKIII